MTLDSAPGNENRNGRIENAELRVDGAGAQGAGGNERTISSVALNIFASCTFGGTLLFHLHGYVFYAVG